MRLLLEELEVVEVVEVNFYYEMIVRQGLTISRSVPAVLCCEECGVVWCGAATSHLQSCSSLLAGLSAAF